MMRIKTGLLPRNCLTLFIPLILLLSSLTALPLAHSQSGLQSSQGGEISDRELNRMLTIAETSLDRAKVFIAQGKFDRVLPEMKIIFQTNLPDKYDEQITDAALIAAKLLGDQGQYEISHKVLDEALVRVKANADKARLLQFQAGIYKLEGKLDKALAAWEQALNFIKKQNQQ